MVLDKSQLKITSIKHDGCVIHFKYKGKHFFLQSGKAGGDFTLVSRIYKRTEMGRCELITACMFAYSRILEGEFVGKTITNITKYELDGLIAYMNNMLKNISADALDKADSILS